MSTLSRAGYKTAYSDPAGQFPTNTTRLITAVRQRTAFDDTADSVVFKNDDYDYWIKTITASGTDTYTITPTVPVAYASDEKWLIRFTNSNTGAATLNRNSLGAKDLLTNSGGALSAGDIVAGGIYIVNYNGTNYRILNVVAGTGSVSGLTSPRIPYATSATTLGDDPAFSWDATNDALTIGLVRIHQFQGTPVDESNSNLFMGGNAGNYTNTTAYRNVGIGPDTLTAISTGDDNVCIGTEAGKIITTGSNNTIIGSLAGNDLVDGGTNVAVGKSALTSVSSGSSNIGIGLGSGAGMTTGDYNIAIGYNSVGGTTGSNNVAIGKSVAVISNTASDQLTIMNAIWGSGNSGGGSTISSGNLGLFANTWGTSAAKVISVGTGTAPSTSITDGFQMYSADIAAGNAAPHFRTEAGKTIKLYQYIDADFGNTVNTGDADTDDLIDKLILALTAHGLIATS